MAIEVEIGRGVGVVYLDNPPVNALSAELRKSLFLEITSLNNRDDISAIVITGRGRCFCGGADIREFDKPERHREPLVPDLIAQIENSTKPLIAAVHGVALGGGCELALGCHYRFGSGDARLGLPEIKLGLMPGAGGTQRLPRLVGLDKAAAMILSGEPVDAAEALACGLLDRVVEGNLVESAVDFAGETAASGAPPRKTSALAVKLPESQALDRLLESLEARYLRRSRGLIAPGHCIESIGNAARLPFAEGMARERELFVRCRESEQSKAQRHLFFAEREASKITGVSGDDSTLVVERAGVIGSGTMGAGIAMCFADAGIPVVVHDASPEAMDTARARIRDNYGRSVRRGRLEDPEASARIERIRWTDSLHAIADADLVVEAVVEEMEVKRSLFSELDRICRRSAILATNTSSLDVDEIAGATRRPEKVIGTHFFSPANVMRLLEIVRAGQTSAETIA
ncbi:MAG: 3-hydroxyacyl-CoA dehydrogenase NAD-binding domain-containing protein, partial [Gammaproteobacteria bacterium]|nr:3-hydroxyacyl-CoA dehydrogenase NAD-binding domain-containing protein [Gammaproteobacteria bacterium]